MRHLWRVVLRRNYSTSMGKPGRRGVEPREPALNGWEGYWVAVKDGEVIAAAHNSRDLVPELHKLGNKARGAVAQYVPFPSDEIVVGVG